tara:strand:- start:324 stop:905 length:582 start_codon:yes stop_codon:yes gene_type:complete
MSLLGLNDAADDKLFIRYMPSTNGWFTGKDHEIDLKYFMLNPSSVKTGWGKITKGEAPDWVFDEALGKRAIRPGDTEEEKMNYKRGFSVDMFIQEEGLRTWSTTTTGSNIGFENLYSEVHAQQAENVGKFPVIEYTGSEAIKIGKGNTRVPQLKLVKWVESDEFEKNEPNGVYEEPGFGEPVAEDNPQDDIPF